ncbi:hypothetical protein [Natrinema halophilum]|uniref:Uncharacterized protein n=1 Tax=Natrinema halophilum TaxID=1699371 RepID=A0A7D5L383_9EURY|nr:hypothetical protein [Natrinema halophilum]QLG48105.1 hypothetical protein HYG82_04205 [Natrinema halophilum]
MNESIRRALASPITIATYGVLVVPLAIGWFETALLTPLALPGYLIYVLGTAIGNAISPGLKLKFYWIPFLVGCYAIAVVVGTIYDVLRG